MGNCSSSMSDPDKNGSVVFYISGWRDAVRIAFFVSNHGFGHIMRNIPVIEELVIRGNDIILVTGESQVGISKGYLNDNVDYRVVNTDAGLIVKPGTLFIDSDLTTRAIEDNLSRWPEMIEMAKGLNAECFVVDIVPWALIAAKELGIPSFLMTSFTWMIQYKPFLPEELLQKYREAFLQADRVLYYELANRPTREFLGKGTEVGFVARPFHEDKVKNIRKTHERSIVFLSLGVSNTGLDFDIDVSSLPYDFISTRAFKLVGDNVEYLDKDVLNTQDYVGASDYCIAKAGWTTVAESMLAGVKSAFFERDDTPEDMMTIEQLKNRKQAISLKTVELKDMGGLLERMQKFNYSKTEYTNSYKYVADLIEAAQMDIRFMMSMDAR